MFVTKMATYFQVREMNTKLELPVNKLLKIHHETMSEYSQRRAAQTGMDT